MIELSDAGLKAIERWEGYERALPDGRCHSYRDVINGKTDIWTAGFGCTEGVGPDTVWTREEADAAFRRELQKHMNAVSRMVTVDLNQNEFDALVSLSYNIGSGGLAKSTVIRKLNAGDRHGAAQAMLAWNKFGGKPVKGLTARRHAEASLFLTPVPGEPEDTMPQTPEKAIDPNGKTAVAAVATTGGAGVWEAAKQMPDLSALGNVQSTGSSLHGFLQWLAGNPLEVGLVVAVVLGVIALPKLRSYLT